MTKIFVKKAGRYNDMTGKAQDCQPGDTLETREWYAQVLVDNGLAGWHDLEADKAPKATEPPPEPAPEQKPTPKRRTSRSRAKKAPEPPKDESPEIKVSAETTLGELASRPKRQAGSNK